MNSTKHKEQMRKYYDLTKRKDILNMVIARELDMVSKEYEKYVSLPTNQNNIPVKSFEKNIPDVIKDLPTMEYTLKGSLDATSMSAYVFVIPLVESA